MEVALGVYSVAADSVCAVSSCDSSCFLSSFSGFATFPAPAALVDSESAVASAAGDVSLLVLAAGQDVAFAAAAAVPPVAFVATAGTPLENSAAGVNLKWRLKHLLDFVACLHTCVTTG